MRTHRSANRTRQAECRRNEIVGTRLVVVTPAILVAGLAACGDFSVTGQQFAPSVPIAQPAVYGAMRGTVDVGSGTMTFEPLDRSAPEGFHGQIYGDQGVTVRLYNSPVVIDTVSTPGVRKLSANIAIKNLLPHAIGDEQSGLAPTDTTGVFVFFTREPVVTTWPCSGCYVRIANYDGTASFDAPNQKYFHWPERIAPGGALTGDTSLVRRLWVFEMSPEVRTFSFTVLVSAAWPAPYETRWKVSYVADSLPDTRSEPRWRTLLTGNGGTWSVDGGALTVDPIAVGQVLFYRRDSVTSGSNAYIEASVRLNSTHPHADLTLQFADGTRFAALGIKRSQVGLAQADENFISGTTYNMSTTDAFHTYLLRKYGADSVAYYVDGVRRGRADYSQLSADPSPATSPRIAFGTFVTRNATSDWQHVTYEIGSPTP
jgi:hypothetical protein